MELALSLVAVVAGLVALALAVRVQGATRRAIASVEGGLDVSRRELEQLRQATDELRRELRELRSTVEAVPAPPLPKARPAGLDDLRERLRAAHESTQGEDDEGEPAG